VYPTVRNISLGCTAVICALNLNAQVVTECPQNIGFETGRLSNWECYTGEISGTGRNFPDAQRPTVISLSGSSPQGGSHTLIPKGSGSDPFGGFSLDAPNGSDYVIRLGNSSNNRGAERISYTVNVPANVEAFSIIFNYAVVFENPDHEYDEQPKFTVTVTEAGSGESTACGSFEFIAPGAGGGIPGFESASSGESVLFKPWSPVMVNLSSYLGKRIRLDFTTNDCSRGRHFGYAYIDFNENCSTPVLGNITCPGARDLTLSTISGLSQYRWFNAATNATLGSGSSLTLSPVPPTGTKIGVEMVPYDGLGCAQTLYTTVTEMYMNFGEIPETCTFADLTRTALTVGNSSDLSYTYWRNPEATIPLQDPKRVTEEGTYYVKGTSSSRCSMVLPAKVVKTKISPVNISPPASVMFPTTVNITTIYSPEPQMKYSYWLDELAIRPLTNPEKIKRGGTYYIKKENSEGCSVITPVNVVVQLPDFFAPNTFTPNGDGINDEFVVVISSKAAIRKFRIFNRWGEVVYETIDIEKYWTGLKEGTPLPIGVYYWVIEADEGLKDFKRSGYVTLLR
jgi:gliding motility-associated-like protein